MKEVATSMIWIANQLALIACFIPYKKQVQTEKVSL